MKVFYSLILLVVLFFSHSSEAQKTLYLGSATIEQLNNRFVPSFYEFYRQTGIKIVVVQLKEFKHLDDASAWYSAKGTQVDFINGQVSQRLSAFHQRGQIKSLNEFWARYKMDSKLGYFKDLITFDKHILGLPHTVNSWQIYYSKSLLNEFSSPPETLEDLINVCSVLSEKGIAPFLYIEQTPWSQMAWFEYIILRTHGLAFYNELTAGNSSYLSKEITSVLQVWQRLIKANCFDQSYHNQRPITSAPLLLRKKVAMIFSSSGLLSVIEKRDSKNDISVMPFPKMTQAKRYESAPINAFIVNEKSKNIEEVYQFLDFISGGNNQAHAQHPQSISDFHMVATSTTFISNDTVKLFAEADGYSIFFDRTVLPSFEKESRPLFNQFVIDADIKAFQQAMEQLRVKHYSIKQPAIK